MQHSPSDEERVLAALSHAAIIANPFNLLGIIAAALIWYSQRQRSAYVADHALHALLFQSLALFVIIAMGSAWGGCLGVSLLPVLLRPELYRTDWPVSFWVALASGLFVITLVLAAVMAGCIGAWHAWHGRSFHYGVVGRLLRDRGDSAESETESPDEEPTSDE